MNNNFATEHFGMRIRPDERKMLTVLARHMKRSQSDAIRILIEDAYLLREHENKQSKRKLNSLATMPKNTVKS